MGVTIFAIEILRMSEIALDLHLMPSGHCTVDIAEISPYYGALTVPVLRYYEGFQKHKQINMDKILPHLEIVYYGIL